MQILRILLTQEDSTRYSSHYNSRY